MKKPLIAVGVTAAALLLSAASCSSDDTPQYQGVCVDPVTNVRLADSACGAGHSDHIWEYLLISQALSNSSARTVYVVPVGQRVPPSYVRTVPPSAGYTRGGVPASGGYSSYKRGGGVVVTTAKPAPKWVEKQSSSVKPAPRVQDSKPKWVQQNPNIKPGQKVQDPKQYRAPYKAPSMPKFRSRP